MGLPDGVNAAVSAQVRERVDEIRIRRPRAGDPIDAPEVFKIVTVMRDDVPSDVKTYRITDAERTALWDSLATLTFKNWIMNQVIPQADTPV